MSRPGQTYTVEKVGSVRMMPPNYDQLITCVLRTPSVPRLVEGEMLHIPGEIEAVVEPVLKKSPLSPRATVALALTAGGYRPSEVAAQMGVKLSTVRTHLHAARRQLEARTTAQAVAIGVRGEWL